MTRISGHLACLALAAGIVAVPAASWAENGAKAKTGQVAQASQGGGGGDFEENRKAHQAKSKENNQNKGSN